MFFSRITKNISKNIKFWIESNSMLFLRKGQNIAKERSYGKADISQKFLEIENFRINEMKKFLENKKDIENLLEEKEKRFMELVVDLDQFKTLENFPNDLKNKILEIEKVEEYKKIKESFEKSENKKLKNLDEYKIKEQSKKIKKLTTYTLAQNIEIQQKLKEIKNLFPKIKSLKQMLTEDKKNIQKLSVI